MGGSIAAVLGIFLAVVGFVFPFIGNGASIAPGAFGLVLGIAGYALGARRFGVAAIVLCALAMFFGLAVSQGLVPGMEAFTPRE
ncbi:MAG: hypothetical protein M3494_17835 [Actinomycetota bacterium]|jgi:hypothetical protein|nr:hypothetical protein [Actinomycetota bacterium]